MTNPNERLFYYAARGGGWHFYANYCRSTFRSHNSPTGSDCALGFRFVKRKFSRKINSYKLHGGSWYGNVYNCRLAIRDKNSPSYSNYGIGFRIIKGTHGRKVLIAPPSVVAAGYSVQAI